MEEALELSLSSLQIVLEADFHITLPHPITLINVPPPAMATHVPAVVPSPTVDAEKWQQRM